MKRLLIAAAVLGMLLASGASAAPGQRLDTTLTGSAEWSSVFVAGTFTVHGTVAKPKSHGLETYSGTLHAGTYGPPTGTCGPVCAPVTGTIDFTGRQGSITATVTGSVGEQDTASSTAYDFTLVLTVTGGTGRYASASGELQLHYMSQLLRDPPGCTACPITDTGTLTGTVARAHP